MEVLLFTLIVFQLIITIFLVKTLIHPMVILKAFTSLSALGLIFYTNIWGVSLTLKTVVVFVSGLLFVDLGFLMISTIKGKKINNLPYTEKKILPMQEYSVGKTIMIVFIQILILGSFVMYGENILSFNSGIAGLSESIIYLKNARSNEVVESLGVWQYGLTASSIIGFTYTYIAWLEYIKRGINKRLFIFIIPVIVTSITYFMTGRRSFLLNLIILILVLVYEFFKKNNKFNLRIQIKFLLSALLLIIFFYFFFVEVGTLFLKGANGQQTALDSFVLYLSGGVAAFDQVYEDYVFSSIVFGQNFFRMFYKILNVLPGANFPTGTINATYYGNQGLITNVFTVNLHYAADFGYIGIILGNIVIGLFYGYLYYKKQNENSIGFWTVLYGYFLSSLLSYTGSESYFVPMTLNIQYIVLFILLLKTPFLKKKNRNSKNHNPGSKTI